MQANASGLGNASQQVFIEALPSVPVLHLNRVRYDVAAGGITKIGKFIQSLHQNSVSHPVRLSHFSRQPRLRVLRDLVISDVMVPNAQQSSEPPHYNFYGVLYRHGESAGSGHYTVGVLSAQQ
jgi:ubiquitin carboxyl-terminal hydrolase 10